MECVFCREDGGEVLWQDDALRVVLATGEHDYPGFCRVIWGAHVAEFSDLGEPERAHLMRVVYAVERAVRRVMQPNKVNLASLGNMVPHVHWHVIPRFEDDTHFPAPVWAEARRAADAGSLDTRRAKLAAVRAAVLRHVGADKSKK